ARIRRKFDLTNLKLCSHDKNAWPIKNCESCRMWHHLELEVEEELLAGNVVPLEASKKHNILFPHLIRSPQDSEALEYEEEHESEHAHECNVLDFKPVKVTLKKQFG